MEDGTPAPAPVPSPAPAPAADQQPAPSPAPAEPPAQPDPWEQKYKVLQGKYNAETAQARQRTSELEAAVAAMQRDLEQMRAQSKAAELEKSIQLTPEEESAYGKDLIELVKKVATATVETRVKDVSQKTHEVQRAVDNVAKTADQVAYERFLSKVSELVPDWEAINADENWLIWLGQYDDLLGGVRQTALDAASNSRDASRVAALFKAFKATRPASPSAQTPAPAAPAQAPQMQQPVAPRGAAAAPSAPQPRFYTEADISSLFAAKRRGEFTPEQWGQISAEIDAAVSEGRVR